MQDEMFELPPFNPTWPRPNTLEYRAIQALIAGRLINHEDFAYSGERDR